MEKLFEITLSKLIRNTMDEFSNRVSNAKGLTVKSLTYVPYKENNALFVKAEVSDYDTEIEFLDVQYMERDDRGDKVRLDDNASGDVVYIKPIQERKNDAKVRCTCLDFYYRFAPFNAAHGALIGNPPPPYVKKTTRPPVNPNEVPGVCKHIIRLHDELRTKGVLK